MEMYPKPTKEEISDFKKKLGKNIQAFRSRKNLSQEKLAEKIGLSHAALGLLEIGRSQPRVSTLISITKALDIKAFELFVFDEIENVDEKLQLAKKAVKKLERNDKALLAFYSFLEEFDSKH